MIDWEKMSSKSSSSCSSSSLVPSSFLVVRFIVLIVSIVRCWLGCCCRGYGGRGSCWLFESAAHEVTSIESHVEPSFAVVSQVVSLVRS